MSSSVSRWAAKTSVLCPACFHLGPILLSHARRGSELSASAARPFKRSLPVPSIPVRAEPDAKARRNWRRFVARATTWSAAWRRSSVSRWECAVHPASSVRFTGAGVRGGSPWMACRCAELVQGGSGLGRRRRSSIGSSTNSSGRSNSSNLKNPNASSSRGVALSSSTCLPSSAMGWIARYARLPG